MSMFGHLRSVRKGDRDWVVPVTLHDYRPPTKRGFVPDGLYAARIVDSDGRPSEKGNGINLRLMLRVEQPVEWAGIELEDWIYLTFDDSGDRTAETHAGYNMSSLQHLLRSVASATPGKVEKLQQPGPDGNPQRIGVGPSMLINKTCYIETQRGEKNAVMKDGRTRDLSGQSEVRWYVGREDFEKAPGPSRVGSASGAAQGEPPELRGGGGQAAAGNGASGTGGGERARGSAKVDDLADF